MVGQTPGGPACSSHILTSSWPRSCRAPGRWQTSSGRRIPICRFPPARTGRCAIWLPTLAGYTGGPRRSSGRARRSASRFDAVPDSQYSAECTAQAEWLAAGAERMIAAVTDAGSAEAWAFGRMAPATFWARRQAHETMVHRADAELAVGRAVVLDAALAADGIDEWLWLLRGPRRQAPGTAALPPGAVLGLHAADDGCGTRDWLVSASADGITVRDGIGPADLTVAGPA